MYFTIIIAQISKNTNLIRLKTNRKNLKKNKTQGKIKGKLLA